MSSKIVLHVLSFRYILEYGVSKPVGCNPFGANDLFTGLTYQAFTSQLITAKLVMNSNYGWGSPQHGEL